MIEIIIAVVIGVSIISTALVFAYFKKKKADRRLKNTKIHSQKIKTALNKYEKTCEHQLILCKEARKAQKTLLKKIRGKANKIEDEEFWSLLHKYNQTLKELSITDNSIHFTSDKAIEEKTTKIIERLTAARSALAKIIEQLHQIADRQTDKSPQSEATILTERKSENHKLSADKAALFGVQKKTSALPDNKPIPPRQFVK